MIDQSGSMNEQWGRSKYKLSWGLRAVNHMIGELIEPAEKDDVAPRVRLGFYGCSNDACELGSKKFLPGADGLVSLVDLAECEDVVEDDENEILLPWVVEEQAYGRTHANGLSTSAFGCRKLCAEPPRFLPRYCQYH